MLSASPWPVGIRRQMRLVGEHRRAGFPIIFTQFIAVAPIRRLEKHLRRLRIEQARVGKPAMPGHRMHELDDKCAPGAAIRQSICCHLFNRNPVLDPVNRQRIAGGAGRQAPEFRDDIAHRRLRSQRRHMPARKAARIRILIVERRHQPQPPAFGDAKADDFKPSRREVFRDQPGARMQEDAAIADTGQALQQLRDAGLAGARQVFIVQYEKRPGPECVGRVCKCGGEGGVA